MIQAKQALRVALQSSLQELAGAAAPVASFESPKQASHGDLAITAAMPLARALKKNPREVAERLVSRVPDVSRLLDRTEELGLIHRERDPEDRRHVTARITEKGLAVLEQATPELDALVRRRFGRLDPEGLQRLIAALEDVRSGA